MAVLLLGRVRLDGIVGDRGGVEVADLGVHPVALADALEPGAGVEGLGVGAIPPQIDAARPTVLGIDELLADQPPHLAEAGRDLTEMFGAGIEMIVDGSRY